MQQLSTLPDHPHPMSARSESVGGDLSCAHVHFLTHWKIWIRNWLCSCVKKTEHSPRATPCSSIHETIWMKWEISRNHLYCILFIYMLLRVVSNSSGDGGVSPSQAGVWDSYYGYGEALPLLLWIFLIIICRFFGWNEIINVTGLHQWNITQQSE